MKNNMPTLPTFKAFNDDLWAEPVQTSKERKARKTTKKQTPELSAQAQACQDMAKMLGIDLFEQVTNPVTKQCVMFYCAYNSLTIGYGWLPTRIVAWGKKEKIMITQARRNAELSYGR